MALRKSLELENGASGDYSRISEIVKDSSGIKVRVELFLNESARQAGKLPLASSIISLGDSNTFFSGEQPGSFAKAYEILKSNENYSDAEDA